MRRSFVSLTTSGTGSEVTPFAVITDSETNVKYPLADFALTPDVAIIDPQFVMSVPKSVTADTGMDVLNACNGIICICNGFRLHKRFESTSD